MLRKLKEYFTPATGVDAPLDELVRLSRLEFYRTLGRRAPTKLVSVPSYVTAVKRHLALDSKNQARQVLATIEGFRNWHALMKAALQESDTLP